MSCLLALLLLSGLPDSWQVGLSCVMLILTAAFLAGWCESVGVRLLFGARPLNQLEELQLQPLVAGMSQIGLGTPAAQIYVAHRLGAPDVRAIGRRSVVLSREVLAAIVAGSIEEREAVAVTAHGAATVLSGMTRQDLALRLWTLPWLILMRIGRPLGHPLRFAWRARAFVVGVAIWRSFAGNGPAVDQAGGIATGCALAALLGLTYAGPYLSKNWRDHVVAAADRKVAEHGLGDDLAVFLSRRPLTPGNSDRIARLDPHGWPAAERTGPVHCSSSTRR